jgi:hypothetical protein
LTSGDSVLTVERISAVSGSAAPLVVTCPSAAEGYCSRWMSIRGTVPAGTPKKAVTSARAFLYASTMLSRFW